MTHVHTDTHLTRFLTTLMFENLNKNEYSIAKLSYSTIIGRYYAKHYSTLILNVRTEISSAVTICTTRVYLYLFLETVVINKCHYNGVIIIRVATQRFRYAHVMHTDRFGKKILSTP